MGSFEVRPIVATVVGLLAVAIVSAAAGGSSMPVLGDGVGLLIGLWVVGSVMCALGMSAMRARYGGRYGIFGSPFGLLATLLLFSGLFGWGLLLDPVARALGGSGQPVSYARAAVVAVGAVMAVKWVIAWFAYLPRR
jgi:hypothetical protein